MSKAKGKAEPDPVIEQKPVEPEILTGKGVFVFPDGSKYDGDWIEVNHIKQRSGHGTFTFGRETYVGEWSNDTMSGNGIYTFSSGSVYQGNFCNNCFDGNGTYTFADGAKYSGEWKNGKMHGEGEYIDPYNVSWKGTFVNGMYDSGRSYISLRPSKSIV